MVLEIVGALLTGGLVLWLVFQPIVAPAPTNEPVEPEPAEETRRGVALLALKEIEFDRATGKLSDTDFETLKARYTDDALLALREEEGQERRMAAADPDQLIADRLQTLRSAKAAGAAVPPSCPSCGPRPEADALFCSNCGSTLAAAAFCSSCGSSLLPDSRFCSGCGTARAA
ncbi:MAG: zinc ribbon domain-containing protein [Gemmatimonadales bacterium]|nr:zinc ribbon domain-containing protein [Gemmatimonadales bacterium]